MTRKTSGSWILVLRSPFESVTEFLKAKSILLVLDNCEHSLDACAELADRLLRSCPRLKILATSRAPLDIIGEATWRVPSLAVPSAAIVRSRQDLQTTLRQYDAIKLFIERAWVAQPDFQVSDRNAAAIAPGRAERAARLLAAVEVQRESLKTPAHFFPRQEHDEGIRSVRSILGERFAEIWADGRAMTLEQTISYALHFEVAVPDRLSSDAQRDRMMKSSTAIWPPAEGKSKVQSLRSAMLGVPGAVN